MNTENTKTNHCSKFVYEFTQKCIVKTETETFH